MFIDDYSTDNSVKIIKHYQKKDERIILIKQKKNRGTLITRNIGVLLSKGYFLIIPDTDDILSNNILKTCYETSVRYNIDMIRFNQYDERVKGGWMKIFNNKIKDSIIYQPKISTFMFYGLGYLKLNDFSVSNKFIKREIFIKSLNNIDNFYLNQFMIRLEDGLINFSLHQQAKSLFILKKVGYY